MNKSNRLISALLTVVMVLSLLTAMPTTASAATTHTAGTENELLDRFINVANGDTIKLMENITCNSSIVIGGAIGSKTVILDLNGKTLNATAGVYVHDQSSLLLKDPSDGQFNVSGVTVATTSAVHAESAGTKVEVSNIIFTTAGDSAVTARDGSEIIVYGNITHTGASGYGVIVRNGSKVTVNGTITVPSGVTFARVEGVNKTRTQYEATSSKPGYLEYKTTDGSYTSFLWVKASNATLNPTAVAFDKNTGGDIAVTVDLAGHTPVAIKNGAYTLQYGTDFTISGNVVSLKAVYLKTLTPGTHTLTFEFSGGVNPALTVTVTGPAGATITPTAVTFNKDTSGDIAVTVDLAGYTPVAIKNGAYELIYNTDYTISGNVVSLKALYLKTLSLGTYSIVFHFSGGVDPVLTVIVIEAVQSTSGMSNFTKTKTYSAGLFTDVNENAWYGLTQQKVIASAYEYGLMQGSGNKFNPTGSMTLAEAVTIAARVHHIYNGGDGVFVQGSPWYQVYVDYAISNGILNPGTFSNYTKAATRAEMAYVFSRALPEAEFATKNTVNSLPDVNNSTPYRDAIFMLYRAGIVEGDSTGAFKPGNNITRAEASAIISRVILPGTRISGKTYG